MILHSAKDIGALVRDRRTAMGWSQAELAERVGVSRVWVVQVEQGKSNAQLGLILRTLRELQAPLRVDLAPRETGGKKSAAGAEKVDLGESVARWRSRGESSGEAEDALKKHLQKLYSPAKKNP